MELDFNAVQRGDGEMSQKLYRVVRTCVEMGDANPIVSIHDQGAGGNCNVRFSSWKRGETLSGPARHDPTLA